MDLRLIETGDGGDLIKNKNDLSVIYGFQNMIYIALFGGNVNQDTPTTRTPTEQAFDFWGNNLLLENDSSIQFNSKTERALNNTALNSAGRSTIQQAVNEDLKFFEDFATVSLTVAIVGVDKISIGVSLEQPGNLQKQSFIYIWDATNSELTVKYDQAAPPIVPPVETGIFDSSFDDFFE